MIFSDRLGILSHIIRFCETSKDKGRIASRVGLNYVQAESYLAILTQQSMLMQNNSKYVITMKGKSFLSSRDSVKACAIDRRDE